MFPIAIEELNADVTFLDIDIDSTAIGINDDRLSFFGTCTSLTKQRQSRGSTALTCNVIYLMYKKTRAQGKAVEL